MPSVEQVRGTLPCAFEEKFSTTYAMIDGNEMFIKTLSDLHCSRTLGANEASQHGEVFGYMDTEWSNLFHFAMYVGCISDLELTCASGFLTTLEDKPSISIMADRGITINDMLKKLNVDLNIPGK